MSESTEPHSSFVELRDLIVEMTSKLESADAEIAKLREQERHSKMKVSQNCSMAAAGCNAYEYNPLVSYIDGVLINVKIMELEHSKVEALEKIESYLAKSIEEEKKQQEGGP